MSLESFKSFVREKPDLVDFVRNKETTWQELYNMHELYGPNSSIWDKFNKTVNVNNSFSLKNIFDMFKNIDMNEVQKGIGSLQKGIGYIQSLIEEKASSDVSSSLRKSDYEPRPMHKYFDD